MFKPGTNGEAEYLEGGDERRLGNDPGDEVGQHLMLDHALHLVGDPGHEVEPAAAVVEAEADGGAHRVGEDRAALRSRCMAQSDSPRESEESTGQCIMVMKMVI